MHLINDDYIHSINLHIFSLKMNSLSELINRGEPRWRPLSQFFPIFGSTRESKTSSVLAHLAFFSGPSRQSSHASGGTSGLTPPLNRSLVPSWSWEPKGTSQPIDLVSDSGPTSLFPWIASSQLLHSRSATGLARSWRRGILWLGAPDPRWCPYCLRAPSYMSSIGSDVAREMSYQSLLRSHDDLWPRFLTISW